MGNDSLLSVCMIVKNEERLLLDALISVWPSADEVIVVDTGSTDRTVEIARQVPKARTFSHPIDQVESFAELRNLAFSKAVSKYVMWMDAGDRVGDGRRLRDEMKKGTTDVIAMNTVYGQRVFLRERVAPRRSAKFVDRVHETMDIKGLSCRAISVPIYHVKKPNSGREDSLPRNVRLLKMMLEEESADHPRRSRWEYYLACDLRTMGLMDEALKHFRIRTEMDVFPEERALAAINVAEILFGLEKYRDAIQAVEKTLKIKKSWRDPYFVRGQCYYSLGDFQQAVLSFELCIGIRRPQGVLPVSEALYGALPLMWIAKCWEAMRIFREAERWVKKAARLVPPEQVPEMNEWVEKLRSARP